MDKAQHDNNEKTLFMLHVHVAYAVASNKESLRNASVVVWVLTVQTSGHIFCMTATNI